MTRRDERWGGYRSGIKAGAAWVAGAALLARAWQPTAGALGLGRAGAACWGALLLLACAWDLVVERRGREARS